LEEYLRHEMSASEAHAGDWIFCIVIITVIILHGRAM